MQYLLIYFFLVLNAGAAEISPGEEVMLKEAQLNEQSLTGSRKIIEHYKKFNREELQKIEVNKSGLKQLQYIDSHYDEIKKNTFSEIRHAHESLGYLDKKFSRKAKLYLCLEETLKKSGHMTVTECKRLNPIKLSSGEEQQIKKWNEGLGLSHSEVKERIIILDKEIVKAHGEITKAETAIVNTEKTIVMLEDRKKKSDTLIRDYKALNEKPEYKLCNATTPTINLEEETPFPGASIKGPFHGVPRDNQDGLDTCYANATRNLLVGLSGGKTDPSFLDIALLYKKSTGGIEKDGLDGGISCEALDEIKKNGYCPQAFAPLETGEKNHPFDSLLGKKNQDSMMFQSMTLSTLRQFLQSRDKLKTKNPELDAQIMKKARWMIAQMKANPRIKLPLPVARVDIPVIWSLRSAFYSKQAEIGISEEKFLEEYQQDYKKFYPHYLKALIHKKGPEQVFDLFKKEMAPFIEKYKFQDKLDNWRTVYLMEVKDDYKDPHYKQSLKDSLAMIKTMSGKETQKDDEFLDDCVKGAGSGMDFFSNLQPLVAKLKELKVDPDKLLDKDGNFYSSAELMQLAVAPACINPENRKKLDFEFSCNIGYDVIGTIKRSAKTMDEQTQMFRDRVLMSLLKGLPLGNTYRTTGDSGHINTIVGLRFNPTKNTCEYLIRESQNGTSDWHSESGIFQKITALTEVRKE